MAVFGFGSSWLLMVEGECVGRLWWEGCVLRYKIKKAWAQWVIGLRWCCFGMADWTGEEGGGDSFLDVLEIIVESCGGIARLC